MQSLKTMQLSWLIATQNTDAVSRYCSHCGKVVLFTDSGYRRQNANGKTIYHFAIYKCEKGHTWNQKIEQFTAKSNIENIPMLEQNTGNKSHEETTLNLVDVLSQGYETLHIQIDIRSGRHRLDKVLSERLTTVSRTQLVKHIEAGLILLDGQPAKGKATLHQQHVVSFDIAAMKL